MSGLHGRSRQVLGAAALLAASLALPSAPASASADKVVSVTAGDEHACALRSDTQLLCWGDNNAGQLGDGTFGDGTTHLAPNPVHVVDGDHPMTGVKAVSAGGFHTCALKTDTTVWCWGLDVDGQLGDNGTVVGDRSNVPVQVRTATGFLTGVAQISAGLDTTCAVKANHTAWCWGDDGNGQLGDGSFGDPVEHDRLTPVQVRRGSGHLTGVTAISAGETTTCARTSDGAAWCWGNAGDGAVGDGTFGDANNLRMKAVRVVSAHGPLTKVAAVSLGGGFACARRTDGSAWCWGFALYGQMGNGTLGVGHRQKKAAQVLRAAGGSLTGVAAIDAGSTHVCTRRSDATEWCWGGAMAGEIGDGTGGDGQGIRRKAVQVKLGSGHFVNVVAITSGDQFSCAARKDHTAWCWGTNVNASLGIGTADSDFHGKPERVQFLPEM